VARTTRFLPTPRGRIGLIVAGSLAAGLVVAVVLVAAPFIPAKENVLTGVVLLGFAFGWALLAVLSVRFSDQPQRWAIAARRVLCPDRSGVTHRVRRRARCVRLGVAATATWARCLDVRSGRRQLRSRTRRWLLYPVLAVLMVASVGGGFETVRESIDAGAYPMPGELVDLGGHRLHLNCTGSGSPTVVLEPGLGGVSSDLAWIAPADGRDSRVCVYDRVGRGWSDAADGPQDATQIAADLHTLLDRAHIPGPYVLAGHSFGGLYVQTFAAHYPDQVASLVLLDSTAPRPGPALPTKTESYNLFGRVSALLPTVAQPDA
jgi:hypothetical protein